MQRDSRPGLVAERLLMLTEALFDAVANDRLDEMNGILQSRQAALDELESLKLDHRAVAILERVAESEQAVFAIMERASATTTQELVQMFSGAKSVRAYAKPAHTGFARAS